MAKYYEGCAVGIDLGTTYSCVAVWQEQHQRVEIIHNDQGNRITPSLVAFTDKQRFIAKNQAATNPTNSVFVRLTQANSIIEWAIVASGLHSKKYKETAEKMKAELGRK